MVWQIVASLTYHDPGMTQPLPTNGKEAGCPGKRLDTALELAHCCCIQTFYNRSFDSKGPANEDVARLKYSGRKRNTCISEGCSSLVRSPNSQDTASNEGDTQQLLFYGFWIQ